jgi:large subunit ribosomal protein L1
MRVAVFAQGENAEAAQANGADAVGMDDLAERMQGGEIDYDVVIASPDAMGVVGKLGPVLGPRGLMPNPKTGTVAADVAGAVSNAKAGQVRYRTDRSGVIHSPIGRASFDVEALRENLQALLADLQKLKPSTSKGVYLRNISVSSTMGAGVRVDQSSVVA